MTCSVPRVSVCIPVYNGSDYISQSIQSVLDQTYENFRLIVSDNCSTDNTGEIVRSFSDPRITYVRNPRNLGLVGNSNRCIELADGEFICILHHDDIMMPDNIERKVSLMDKCPNVGFVHSDVTLIDEEGNHLKRNMFSGANQNYIKDGLSIFRQYILKMPVGASVFIGAVLARRSCYTHLGVFNTELPNTSDNEMWMRMALFYDIACIGEPLVKYRLHQGMTSTSINDSAGLNLVGFEEHYRAALMVLERHRERIPQWAQLRRQVLSAFSEMAVEKGNCFCKKRTFAQCSAFLKKALIISPWIIRRRDFWSVLARLLLASTQTFSKSISGGSKLSC